jgi:uncharacterized repeat protein (TIGR01451 family)
MPFIIEGTGGGPNPTHVTISFDVLVTSQGNPNPVVNTANLSWMGMYGSASASTAILTPSITLAKTVGTQAGVCATTDAITVPPGTTVYYCYTATNTGNVALNTHDLYDTVLGQLFTGNSIPLDPGASYSYIAAPYVANATVTNTGTWTAWADETHSTEASDTATVTVYAPQSDLAVIKSGEPDSVRVGETITYTLVVTNYGPDAATGVMLEDTLPVSVTFESASPGCTNLSGVVTCDIGDLAVDESVTRYIVVTANAVGIATNTAEVWSDNTDPDPDNNIATEDTLIIPAMFNFYLPIINKH